MEDHLDNEISVSGELTESGGKGAAKSRTISAIDRVVGSIIDWPNTFIEGSTAKRRAKVESEVTITKAIADRAAKLIAADDEFARRVVAAQFGDAARKQLNKEAVAALALEELRDSPPSEEEAKEGPKELGSEFLDRFQRYAEDATTDELRERWGRVLASEIRKPGTFSRKVMRAVDELDADVALEFEKLCAHRLHPGGVVKNYVGELEYSTRTMLVEAGLLIDPGEFGQVSCFHKQQVAEGHVHLGKFGNWAAMIAEPFDIPAVGPLIMKENGEIGIRTYLFTSVGRALATILPDHTEATVVRLLHDLLDLAGDKLHTYRAVGGSFVEMPLPPLDPSIARQ